MGDTTYRHAGANHAGAMVAAMLDPDVAHALAVPGGEPPRDMHCTLLYLDADAARLHDGIEPPHPGAAAGWTRAHAIGKALGDIASTAPLEARTGGMRAFPEGDDGTPWVMDVICDGLHALRESLKQRAAAWGCHVVDRYDYHPHVTLAYGSEPKAPADMPFTIRALSLVMAGKRRDWPLAAG